MGAMQNDLNRCNFMFSDDRRCRNPVQTPGQPFCYFHANRSRKKPQSLPSDESAARAFFHWLSTHPLDNATTVNRAINQLFFLVLGKRLSIRRADSLVRMIRLSMKSLPEFREELYRPGLLADSAPLAEQFLSEVEPLLASATPPDVTEQAPEKPESGGPDPAQVDSLPAQSAA